jgi:MFS family permease
VPGTLLSSVGLFGLVWGAIRAGNIGWTNVEVLLALTGGLVAMALFVAWELRTAAPMLPMHFFRNRVFTSSAVASLMMYAALFGALFLVTQLLQVGLGSTPLQAGLRTLPMAVMPMLLAPVGCRLSDRYGFRPMLLSGLAAVAIGVAWLASTVTPTVDYLVIVPALALIGAGSALFFAPLAAAMLSAVAPHEHGQVSGAAAAIRELAVVIGVTVLGLVFTGQGGYGTPAGFVAGFVPAMWVAAGMAALGLLVAAGLLWTRAIAPMHTAQPMPCVEAA